MVNIRSFFENKNVFITGGLGFVGKLVVEKLIRSCPKINSINLLVRPKKNASVEERSSRYMQQSVFNNVRRIDPAFGKKLTFCRGDLMLPSLGLNEYDTRKLVEETDVVLHVAATVNFFAPLLESLDINYFGTKKVLDLSSQMNNLSSFVYVSTAYANADKQVVQEIVYPNIALQNYEEVEELKSKLIAMDPEERKTFETKILGTLPNTYTFTKHLTESLVHEYKSRIPAAIVRPSVVGAALQEPEPGFIDNYFAATGVFYFLGSKEIPFMYANTKNRADIIPADLCANSIIAVAAARGKGNPDAVPVYHSTAHDLYTYGNISKSIRKICQEVPLRNISGMWGPFGRFVDSRQMVFLGFIIIKFIPALIFDILSLPISREFRRLKVCLFLYEKLFYFDRITACEWEFSRSNTMALHQSLTSEEKQIFPLESNQSLTVNDYMRLYIQGIQNYVSRSKKNKK